MESWLKQLLTGKDNATLDLGRVSWIVGLGIVLCVSVYEILEKQVNIMELAQALGIISGEHGAAIWAKKDTEPQ